MQFRNKITNLYLIVLYKIFLKLYNVKKLPVSFACPFANLLTRFKPNIAKYIVFSLPIIRFHVKI